jgi:hypothetical protein
MWELCVCVFIIHTRTHINTSATLVEYSAGKLKICNTSFRNINFLSFVQYYSRVIHTYTLLKDTSMST